MRPAAPIPAYERDPRLTSLEVDVLAVGREGDRAWAELSDTVLYPEGGGQPADTGRLGGVAVVDVQKVDGAIRHYLAGPVARGPARLELDWPRRFDHMQQHSAQHVLTAVALTRFGWRTTAFHLGATRSDIELDVANPPAALLAELAEAVAVEIRAARAISARRVSPEQAAALPVRSRGLPAGHQGDVRLVEIEGLDLNTCGGTHLASTAEIEVVHLVGTEALRGGTRLYWLAGGRGRARLQALEGRLAAVRQTLDASEDDLLAVLRGRLDAQREGERTLRQLRQQLAGLLAERLAASPGTVVELHEADADGAWLGQLARRFAAIAPGKVALLTAGGEGAGFFALAVGEAAAVDLRVVGPAVASLLGGRGGGSGGVFQGRASTFARRPEALALLAG